VKRLAVALLGLVACSRPAPSPRGEAKGSACASCHAEIDAEWRGSFHRAAFTDGTFQASLALEKPEERGFCVRCHAPGASRDDGVGCTSCHARPHEHGARAALACAGCHEFTFDQGRTELVQKTVSEHAASRFADVPCVGCHAPPRGRHTDHRFVAGHAPDWVARRVEVTGARVGSSSVAITIDVGAGHAFPTGDMFRRARLLVFAEDASGRIVDDAERVFGRTWGTLEGGPHAGGRTETGDTRIRGRWTETLAFDHAPIARVRWTLLFERVLSQRGPLVDLVSSDPVAEGEVRLDAR
jgi:hypothetical protein